MPPRGSCSSPAPPAEIARYDDGPFAGRGFPYSESARVGNLLFLTGQTGEDRNGNLVPGGIKAEAEQVMSNIRAALARRGLALKHVVKCTVFLADIAEWGAFNEVYKKHFSQPYPARSALGASGLAGGAGRDGMHRRLSRLRRHPPLADSHYSPRS